MAHEWVAASPTPLYPWPSHGGSMTAVPCTRRRRARRHAPPGPSSPQWSRRKINMKRWFYPWWACEITRATTARYCSGLWPQTATYT
jgi:hypothetical protein